MGSAPALSVVLPTYRRDDILRACLEHLERQTIADQIEVVVVSDGHNTMTQKLVTETPWKIPVRFFSIPKAHQSVARNRGIAEARAPIMLLIQDDILLAPGACEAHLKMHRRREGPEGSPSGVAVLGFTTWDPSLEITPLMKWLEESGWQFGYPMIEQYAHGTIPEDIQHRFTYASHVSLPTDIARAHPFREGLTLYGWEDILWGMDLRDAGIRLVYEPEAIGHHRHSISYEQSLERMETIGRSVKQVTTLDPRLAERVPTGWKLLAYRVLAMLPTMRGLHAAAFLRGLANSEKNS